MASLSLPVPAVQGEFGDKLATFQTQILPEEIVQVLGHDPRSSNWKQLPAHLRDMYVYLQRKTSSARRDSLEAYIEHRLGANAIMLGAFPAICIGMTRPATFTPVGNQYPGIGDNLGILGLELSHNNQRLLLDGLARITAALSLIEDYAQLGRETSLGFSFPVTFYAPKHGALSMQQLGQLFHDFNFLQTSVSVSHAIALDKSDLYIQLTLYLSDVDPLKRYGGVETRIASLNKNSQALVVQQVLLRFVRGACEGFTFQVSNRAKVSDPYLKPSNFRQVATQLEEFLTRLANGMGKERFTDRDALHLTSPGWQVLGLLFHDLYVRLQPTAHVLDVILHRVEELDWSRYNPLWLETLGEPEMDGVTGKPIKDPQGRSRVKITRLGSQGILRLKDAVYDAIELTPLLEREDKKTQAVIEG